MKTSDLFEETTSALTSNKMRSGLTILGIVIGIASVIAMVAIGNGSQNSIDATIQSIGSNLIMITPGFARGPANGPVSAGRGGSTTLTQADATAIQSQISSIAAISPELSKRYQVTATGNNTNTTVTGTVPSYAQVRNEQLASGSFIADQDIASLNRVAVLGPTTETERLESLNIKPLSLPKEGAGGKKIMFLHPKETNKVLIELSDEKKPRKKLKKNLEELSEDYRFVFFDCPPNLTLPYL